MSGSFLAEWESGGSQLLNEIGLCGSSAYLSLVGVWLHVEAANNVGLKEKDGVLATNMLVAYRGLSNRWLHHPFSNFITVFINSLQTWPMFYICNTLLPILGRSTSVMQLLCRIWCHGIQKIRISCGFWWLLICTCFRELVTYIWSQLGMVGWLVGNAHDPSWRSDRRKNLKSIQMKTSHILPPSLSPLYTKMI